MDSDMNIFSQCIKPELEVLIKGLEKIDYLELTIGQREYKDMCLATLKSELEERYLQWEKK